MAKIYSHSVGRAKGSIGLVTYRTVKGRTLASQKVQPRGTRPGMAKYTERTYAFALMAAYANNYKASIKKSFDPTRFGTARNAFAKYNANAFYDVAVYMLANSDDFNGANLYDDPISTFGDYATIVDSVNDARAAIAEADPLGVAGSLVRIRKNGYPAVAISGSAAWTIVPDPEPIIPPVITSAIFYHFDDLDDEGGRHYSYGWRIEGTRMMDAQDSALIIKGEHIKADSTLDTHFPTLIGNSEVKTAALIEDDNISRPSAYQGGYDGVIKFYYEDEFGERHDLYQTDWSNEYPPNANAK